MLVKESLNEGIILPDDNLYKKMIDVFFNAKNTMDPFTYLNDELKPEMELIDFDGHLSNLDPRERQMLSQSNQIPQLGIRLYGFDPDENKVMIFVDKTFDDKLIEIEDNKLKETLDQMWSGIGHENIHQQQVSKMKTVQNPTFHSKEEYLGNKQEIMAHAFSFVQEMKEKGLDEEQLINLLKKKHVHFRQNHPILHDYKSLGGKPLKLFIKYAVQYIEELY